MDDMPDDLGEELAEWEVDLATTALLDRRELRLVLDAIRSHRAITMPDNSWGGPEGYLLELAARVQVAERFPPRCWWDTDDDTPPG